MNLEKRYEFILQHGWGLSSSCWDKWKKTLEGYGDVLTPDRGYFGNIIKTCDFKTDKIKVLVSHSFGLYLFSKKALKSADYLIIISGFTKFHPEDEREKRRSRMLMRLMKKKLGLEPEKLLHDFYNGHDLRGRLDKNPVIETLYKDLSAIDEDEPDMDNIKNIKNILIVQGGKDMVVPLSRAKYLNHQLKNSKLAFFEKEDHALPFTRTDDLVGLIIDFIEKGEVPDKYLRIC